MSLCACLLYTIDCVKKACKQHWLLLWRYFDNKRQIKQRLSCNAGQAKFLAARAEILAGEGGKPTAGGAEPTCPPPLTLTTVYIQYCGHCSGTVLALKQSAENIQPQHSMKRIKLITIYQNPHVAGRLACNFWPKQTKTTSIFANYVVA